MADSLVSSLALQIPRTIRKHGMISPPHLTCSPTLSCRSTLCWSLLPCTILFSCMGLILDHIYHTVIWQYAASMADIRSHCCAHSSTYLPRCTFPQYCLLCQNALRHALHRRPFRPGMSRRSSASLRMRYSFWPLREYCMNFS